MPDAAAPRRGTVLGFDFGVRRIGVASGEMETARAHALTVIDQADQAARFAEIARLVKDWRPVRLVVGLPLALSGEPHDMTRRAQRFARQLSGRHGLPVDMVDERLTSVEAESLMRADRVPRQRRKESVDALAAQLLLQDYLDRQFTHVN